MKCNTVKQRSHDSFERFDMLSCYPFCHFAALRHTPELSAGAANDTASPLARCDMEVFSDDLGCEFLFVKFKGAEIFRRGEKEVARQKWWHFFWHLLLWAVSALLLICARLYVFLKFAAQLKSRCNQNCHQSYSKQNI